MQKHIAPLLALFCSGLPMVGASAATYEADLTDVQFTTAELMPGNGRSPAYIALPIGFQTLSQADARFPSNTGMRLGLMATTSASDTDSDNSFSMASTDASSLHASGGSVALGSATTTVALTSTPYYDRDRRPALFLAPQTSFTISADYHIEIEADNTNCTFAGCQVVAASVYIQSGNDFVNEYLSKDSPGDPWAGTLMQDGSISYTISNDTDQWQVESFALVANGYDNVLSTPVPEPSDDALMLAGLGALGLVARRRKR